VKETRERYDSKAEGRVDKSREIVPSRPRIWSLDNIKPTMSLRLVNQTV